MAQRITDLDSTVERSHDALLSLVRLLARSAAREYLAQQCGLPETVAGSRS